MVNNQQAKRRWEDGGAADATYVPASVDEVFHALRAMKESTNASTTSHQAHDLSPLWNTRSPAQQPNSQQGQPPLLPKRVDSGAWTAPGFTDHGFGINTATASAPFQPGPRTHYASSSHDHHAFGDTHSRASYPYSHVQPFANQSVNVSPHAWAGNQLVGTQANPIASDDDPVPQPAANARPATTKAPPEKRFYGVARGLIPGVYDSTQEKKDVKLCSNDWPGVKSRVFRTREEAEEYVQARRISDTEHIAAVRQFFAPWSYASTKEWLRRKELYQWFRQHAASKSISWAASVPGPTEMPYIKEQEEGRKVPGAELHEPSYNQEQYLRPGLSTTKAQPKVLTALHPSNRANGKLLKQVTNESKPKRQKIEQNHAAKARRDDLDPYEPPRSSQDIEILDHRQRQPAPTPTRPIVNAPPVPSMASTLPVALDAPQEGRTEPTLCPEQRGLVDLILSGKNVFYTGSAGCGKSTVLKAFVKELREMGQDVRIVAPTGKAALEVNGSTYFTFAGWTPSHFKKQLKDLKQGAHQTWVNKRMRAVDVLIIDEISMLENHIFERLNEVMKEARGSHQAFGGVQMVVTGDFCQLPPVKPFKHCYQCGREMQYRHFNQSYTCKAHGTSLEKDKWAFRSQAWKECKFEHVNLTTIHRQKDRAFIDILERCRMGKQLTNADMDLLLHHECNVQNPTRLYSTRAEVARLNESEYAKLKAKARTFRGFDDALIHAHHPNLQYKSQKTPEGVIQALQEGKFEARVDLKEGMRVVLQVNLSIDQGLVNGAQGVIVDWEPYDKDKLPRVEKKEGHAGSRASDVLAPPVAAPTINGEHAQYREARLKDFVKAHRIREWPIVEFDNGLRKTIYAECLCYEFGDDPPYSIMSRTQVPLIAGWAMTVHKSQGMTLNQVEVDLEKSFEEGQMYVALSRATSLEGLRVRSLGHRVGNGNPEVHEFLRDYLGVKI